MSPITMDKELWKKTEQERRRHLMEVSNTQLVRARVLRPEGISFANDGIHVQTVIQGEVTHLSLELFQIYQGRGWVEEDKALTAAEVAPETKAVTTLGDLQGRPKLKNTKPRKGLRK